MRVLVLSHPPADGSVRRGFPEKHRSWLWPIFWWRTAFAERGMTISTLDFADNDQARDFDVVAVSSRALNSGAVDEKFRVLSRLRETNGRVVYLDQSDGTGRTDFSVMEYVSLYAKRHLLREPDHYTQSQWVGDVGHAYYSDLLGIGTSGEATLTALARRDFGKVRLSWGFHHSVYPIPNKVGRLISQKWPHPPRIPGPTYPKLPEREERLSHTGAFFFGKDDGPIGKSRRLAREHIARAGGAVLVGQISKREFHRLLGSVAIGVSPFGYGEMCFRDFELAMTGRFLAKPSVDHLVTYPQILKERKNYLPLSWDPRVWADEIREAEIGHDWAEALHEAYRLEFGVDGANRFVTHLVSCIFGDEVCGHCKPLLASYIKAQTPEEGSDR